MANQKVTVEINSVVRKFDFEFTIHKSKSVENQRIEEGFYLKHNKSLHKGSHIEIEITSPLLIEHALYQKGLIKRSKLHIHKSKKHPNEHYVCWTGNISNTKEMWRILKFWCLGTAYSIIYKTDFVKMLEEEKIDHDDHTKFYQVMESKYKLTLTGSICMAL